MLNCPHTGVALAVLIKLLKDGKIDKAERVVVISTAHGLKFTDFKVRYHEETLDFPCHFANKPIELPPSVDAVKEALSEALQKRRKKLIKRSSNSRQWKNFNSRYPWVRTSSKSTLFCFYTDRSNLKLLF